MKCFIFVLLLNSDSGIDLFFKFVFLNVLLGMICVLIGRNLVGFTVRNHMKVQRSAVTGTCSLQPLTQRYFMSSMSLFASAAAAVLFYCKPETLISIYL